MGRFRVERSRSWKAVPMPTRIVLVDDHQVFAETLCRALTTEPGLEVVALAATRADAVDAVRRERPDVVVTDHRLGGGPGEDGVRVAIDVLDEFPGTAVVMLTASEDDRVLIAAIEAGCTGFVTKTQPLGDVIAAIRSASAGEAVVNPTMLARVLPRLARRREEPVDHLTKRELEVLEIMAGGASNQVIADQLFISRDTVRNHVSSILQKLGAHSKLEAVAHALQRGIVEPPGSAPA
jgi:DNA-binding NarL/FixJ family response regulator